MTYGTFAHALNTSTTHRKPVAPSFKDESLAAQQARRKKELAQQLQMNAKLSGK